MKRSRKKQIAAAPKFGLFVDGAGWLANQQDLTGVNFTQDKGAAMQFAEGFDNPDDKLSVWNAELKRVFGPVTFQVVYL